jgi:hypothetical protein
VPTVDQLMQRLGADRGQVEDFLEGRGGHEERPSRRVKSPQCLFGDRRMTALLQAHRNALRQAGPKLSRVHLPCSRPCVAGCVWTLVMSGSPRTAVIEAQNPRNSRREIRRCSSACVRLRAMSEIFGREVDGQGRPLTINTGRGQSNHGVKGELSLVLIIY